MEDVDSYCSQEPGKTVIPGIATSMTRTGIEVLLNQNFKQDKGQSLCPEEVSGRNAL